MVLLAALRSSLSQSGRFEIRDADGEIGGVIGDARAEAERFGGSW